MCRVVFVVGLVMAFQHVSYVLFDEISCCVYVTIFRWVFFSCSYYVIIGFFARSVVWRFWYVCCKRCLSVVCMFLCMSSYFRFIILSLPVITHNGCLSVPQSVPWFSPNRNSVCSYIFECRLWKTFARSQTHLRTCRTKVSITAFGHSMTESKRRYIQKRKLK
jgi:hypothetical protein